MPESLPHHSESFTVRADQPLVGVIVQQNGTEMVRYTAGEPTQDRPSRQRSAGALDARGLPRGRLPRRGTVGIGVGAESRPIVREARRNRLPGGLRRESSSFGTSQSARNYMRVRILG